MSHHEKTSVRFSEWWSVLIKEEIAFTFQLYKLEVPHSYMLKVSAHYHGTSKKWCHPVFTKYNEKFPFHLNHMDWKIANFEFSPCIKNCAHWWQLFVPVHQPSNHFAIILSASELKLILLLIYNVGYQNVWIAWKAATLFTNS